MMTPKILFFTAVLFVFAAVGYPANEIEWGKGRPGVRVVTNAPSRAEFDALVSVNGQYASVAASASNALRAVAITGPQSNVIASAGVHTNRTDNPHAVTAAQVGAPSIEALYTLMATSRVTRLYSNPSNWVVYAGSGTLVSYSVGLDDGPAWHFEGSTDPQPLPYPIDYYSSSDWNVTKMMGIDWIVSYYAYQGAVSVGNETVTNLSLVAGESFTNIYYDSHVLLISTNTVTYYLPTNLVMSETWSYIDMTNWMADGNAGQVWVTDLANTAAHARMNQHTAAANDHPQYAKITGASLTNAVLVGGNAITTNMLPFAGCRDMGATNAIVIDGSHVYYRAAPSSGYSVTVSVSAASGRTYCLTTYSTSAVSYAANISLRNSWTAGGTNTMVFYPGETNSWFVKGSAP